MSKLYSTYLALKQLRPDTIFLFKSGIFYIALQDDAQYLSQELDLKLTHLNEDIVKCGFPTNSLEKYKQFMKQKQITFELVTIQHSAPIPQHVDYLHNQQVANILQDIVAIDFNHITFRQAFEMLYQTQQTLKNIPFTKEK